MTPEELEAARKYGLTDMDGPVRKAKPPEPLITPAEWAAIDLRRADAAYLGQPKAEEHKGGFVAVMSVAFRREADAKRKRAAEGVTRPDKFPDVEIRTGESAIALRTAETFDAIASDLGALR